MVKKNIINFNHISKELSEDTIDELKKLYIYYHKYAVCLKWQYKRSKKLKLILNIISIGLTVSGTVCGVITLNPIVLGITNGVGVSIQGYIAKTNLNNIVRDYKFAYITYDKILTELRAYLRGLSFNEVAFLSNAKVIDDTVTDLGLTFGRMSRKYQTIYE